MFKKIAHNSTLNSLPTGVSFGNKDLKPLQDLISLEKTVLLSLQKLSADITRASEALKIWGLGEGDDLGDTLTASSTLMLQFATALTTYSAHGNTIREQMKSVRGREEALDESKRKRKALGSKAEAAEKKLAKMSPDHKNVTMQTDALNQLQAQIRQMDSEIMSEEAAMSDFKRTSTKMWMMLKFGGLQECTEKTTIACEYGKLIIGIIPNDITQPGFSRAMYQGHGKTQSLVDEALLAVNDIHMSQLPSEENRASAFGSDNTSPLDSGAMSGQGWPPPDGPPPLGSALHTSPDFGQGHFLDAPETGTRNSDSQQTFSGLPPISSQMTGGDISFDAPPSFGESTSPPMSQGPDEHAPRPESVPPPRPVDDFGVRSPGSTGPAGGHFATFPVKGPGGPRGISLRDDPPSLASNGRGADDSFSSSIAAALGSGGDAHPTSAPAAQPGSPPRVQTSISPPPPGAAPPAISPSRPPWMDGQYGDHVRQRTESSEDDAGLAYMADDNGHDAPHQDIEYDKKVRFNSGIPSPMTPWSEKPVSPEPPALLPPAVSPQVARPPFSESISSSRRVPPPNFESEVEVKTRNAAAAEDIKREMDALGFDPGTTASSLSISSPAAPESVTAPLDLAPPSAPFARPQVSPRPSMDSLRNRSSTYDNGPQRVSLYDNGRSNRVESPVEDRQAPSSPAHQFARQPVDGRASPSPRQGHSTVPSISLSGLPPADSTVKSALSSGSPGGSAFATPSEYPRNMYANRSATSLVSTPPIGTATGKISAAAFRRPQNRGASSGLPTSPYPNVRGGAGISREPSPSPSTDPPAGLPPTSSPLVKSASPMKEEEDFDYIGAYQNQDDYDPPQQSGRQAAPSPPIADYADYGKLGKVRIANEPSGYDSDLR